MAETSVEASAAAARRAGRLADLVEVRLDSIESGDYRRLFRPFPRPLILTARRRREGGGFDGTERERVGLLQQVLSDSPHWVDVEDDTDSGILTRMLSSGRVLLSRHDHRRTPRNLEQLARSLRRRAGRSPIKLVTRAKSLDDCVRIRRVLRESAGPIVMFAMGEAGVVSRILAPRWGSLLTYGAYRSERRTAAGQPTLEELVRLYRVRDLRKGFRLYVVAGGRVGSSLSPLIHNTLFRRYGMNAVYSIAPGRRFETILAALGELGAAGVSVTVPFKRHALEMAARATPLAVRVGAANTLVRGRGGWHAANTDVGGFVRALRALGGIKGRRCVVLGAGGAARACVAGLRDAGAEVVVAARRETRARAAAGRESNAGSSNLEARSLRKLGANIWVNATGAELPQLSAEILAAGGRGRTAMDLAYGSDASDFVRKARRAGLTAESGLRMLLWQALEQFELFTGIEPSSADVRVLSRKLTGGAGFR